MDAVIRPKLSEWDFGARERALFASAGDIPTWRLANQARRMLADVVKQLSYATPTPEVGAVDELEPVVAGQLAAVQLAALVVRGTGSIICLIGSGYEGEAFGPTRIVVEAVIRGRQVNDDATGETARKILKGHRPGSLKTVAHRYGEKADIEFLDRFAHADVLGLLAVSTPRPGDGLAQERDLMLLPQRGAVRPAFQLLNAAYNATMFSVILANAFNSGVEIPGWISTQLRHYKDHPLPGPL